MLQPKSQSASAEGQDEIKAILSAPVSPSMSSYFGRARRSSSGTPTFSVDGAPQFISSLSCSTPKPTGWLPSSLSSTNRSASAPPSGMAIKSSDLADVGDDVAAHCAKLVALRELMAPIFHAIDDAAAPAVQDVESEAQQAPDLDELARLLRLQRYQKRKRLQTETAFRQSRIQVSKTNRLNASARHVRRTLTDCLRSEDKHSFANLFNAYHGSYTPSRPMSFAIDDCVEANPDGPSASAQDFWTVMSPGTREAMLSLLSAIRFDPRYVAERLDALNQRELLAILPDGGHARSGESVLATYPRSSSRSTKPMGYVVDRLIDDLSGHALRSPLELMLHLHNPSGSSGTPYGDSTNFWAGICANMIAGQKHGSHKLVPALFNIWSDQKPWPGKERFRLWVLRVLNDGQFILEQPNRQTFRMRSTGQGDLPSEEHRRTEDFFTRSVNSLLDLLGAEDGSSAIPDGARDFAQSMFEQLANFPDHQKALPKYLTRWWLFASFIPDLLTLPESHGLLCDYYVSDAAYHKLLRQVAARSQKAVLDVIYPWRYGTAVSADITARVHRVLARLDFPGSMSTQSIRSATSAPDSESRGMFLAVSANDVSTLINALHPCRRQLSLSPDRDTIRSGLLSSSSSISGFSLFPSPDTPVTPELSSSLANVGPSAHQRSTASVAGYTVPSREISAPESTLADSRIELEEWLTAHPNESEGHWTLLRPAAHDLRFEAYDAVLTQVLPEASQYCEASVVEHATEMAASKLAIETLLMEHVQASGPFGPGTLNRDTHTHDVVGHLLDLLDQKIASSEAQLDFVTAHIWLCSMRDMEDFVSTRGCRPIIELLWHLRSSALQIERVSQAVIDQCKNWSNDVDTKYASAAEAHNRLHRSFEKLRAKMWYISDVRTSSNYDQAQAVASALRVMGKPRSVKSPKQMPPLRHWNGSRITNQNNPLKSDAQILDMLGTSPDLGGPNKLTGEQARLTSTWLESSSIQNICAGEERLHKLCMELRKSVEQLVPLSLSDSALLRSNTLFSRDTLLATRPYSRANGFTDEERTSRRFDSLRLQTDVPPSIDSVSTASRTLSSMSSREYFDTRSPTLTTKSSGTFWSPAMTEVQSPSSVTSVSSMATRAPLSPRRPGSRSNPDSVGLAEDLREALAGFLLSDIGTGLYGDGSETDMSFWRGLGGELTEQHLQSQREIQARSALADDAPIRIHHRRRHGVGFDFESAFENIFALFASECDPYRKLRRLDDIQVLLPPYMTQRCRGRPTPEGREQYFLSKTTKLESTGDQHVEGFYILFCNSSIRPPGLFRDLQYIASLLPTTILDSPKGKAFWNAAAAAARIKLEARKIFVETADSIIAHHTSSRGHGRSASVAQQQRDSAAFKAPTRTPSAEAIARYTMADAATLLQIAAKEGDPAAQRELATLYLTHPELMDHVIAPFARPRDVFREELEAKWRKDKDAQKCDPRTMCVAHHWMELAAKGGDALAREVLRQQDEMERLP